MKPPNKACAYLQRQEDTGPAAEKWDLSGKTSVRLGRGANNDIDLNYPWISRNHAIIQVEENGSIHVLDLGSSNGTFVNGQRVHTPTTLRTGDILALGKSKLIFFLEGSGASAQDSANDTIDATVAFLDRAIVTVLVCDIREFTPLSEAQGVGPVSQLLQVWTKRVNDLVKNHGGIVDKFIGDAVMALWEQGPDMEETVVQSLRTALEISRLTSEIGKTIPSLQKTLRIGAALNTGEAVVGNLGVEGRRDFTVVGDAVNIAFRLEEMTSKLGVDLLMGGEAGKHLQNVDKHFTKKIYAIRGKEETLLTYACNFDQLAAYLSQYAPTGLGKK